MRLLRRLLFEIHSLTCRPCREGYLCMDGFYHRQRMRDARKTP